MELGKIALPKLRRLEIVTGGFSRANLKSIVTAAWPELEALTLYFGDEEYGGDCTVDDLGPILAASGIPRVKHLGLANAPFADELARELPRSKVLAQLATLDISKGTLSDEGAAAIIERAAAFTHLESLDVSESFLSEGVVERLTSALGKVAVSADDQGDPEDEYRFVQVAE